jgi:hypothetical protein
MSIDCAAATDAAPATHLLIEARLIFGSVIFLRFGVTDCV